MNYKDVLIDNQSSAVSAFTMFILQYLNYDNFLAGFIEGQDHYYYYNKIELILGDLQEVCLYSCNGKSQVEEVKKMIENNCNIKKNVKCLYFVDKDYDFKERKDGIFYTDFYSVENYYCQKDVIIKLLKDCFNINKYNPDFNICINLFDDRFNIYNQQMIKINAFCYAIRKNEFLFNSNNKYDFKNIKFENFVKCKDFENFEMNDYDYLELKKLFKTTDEVSEADYENALSEINEYNLRGKWELKFYIWFLNGLRTCINNGQLGLTKNKRLKFSFDHFMENYSYQAISSNQFNNYINSYFKDGESI